MAEINLFILRVFFSVLLILTPYVSQAAVTGLWPYVTGYQVSKTSGLTTYMTLLPITLSDEEASMYIGGPLELAVVAPVALFKINGKHSWIRSTNSANCGGMTCLYQGRGRTWGDVIKFFADNGTSGQKGSSILSFNFEYICLQTGHLVSGAQSIIRPPSLGGEVLADPGSCDVVVPPSDEWCAMVTPTLEFNFGSMTTEQATSGTVSLTRDMQVECTADMNYIFFAVPSSDIELSNGMSAQLSVPISSGGNGYSISGTLNGTNGINNVSLQARLTNRTPTSTGPFSGSTVLGVTYP